MAQPNLPAVTAIVVAAGASRRMGFDKLSYRLPDGRTVLETSCAALTAHPAITQLVLVCGGNRAACEAIDPCLPEGQTSVGIRLEISHTSATPVGLEVRAEAELTAIEGKKLTFRVTAFDEKGEIGSGTHQRVLVQEQKFLDKAYEKL